MISMRCIIHLTPSLGASRCQSSGFRRPGILRHHHQPGYSLQWLPQGHHYCHQPLTLEELSNFYQVPKCGTIPSFRLQIVHPSIQGRMHPFHDLSTLCLVCHLPMLWGGQRQEILLWFHGGEIDTGM